MISQGLSSPENPENHELGAEGVSYAGEAITRQVRIESYPVTVT